MKSSTCAFLLVAYSTIAQAAGADGDPTDLARYPSCVATCIPPSFGPPANCGGLSNRSCICQNPLFTDAVATCTLTKCSREETTVINRLFVSLCASIGGVGSILSEEERVFATASLEIPATPTYPPNVTRIDQASAILATATPAPNLGNPAGGANPGVFPPCILLCAKLTAGFINNTNSLAQVCGIDFRLQNAICKAALCPNSERQISQLLAQQLCGPYYRNNPAVGSSVSFAIDSATSVVQAAIAGKNLSNSAEYPGCARECIVSINPDVCNNTTATRDLVECQSSACEGNDIIRAAASTYLKCAPNSNSTVPANVSSTNQTTTQSTSSNGTTVQPFTSEAAHHVSWTLTIGLLATSLGTFL